MHCQAIYSIFPYVDAHSTLLICDFHLAFDTLLQCICEGESIKEGFQKPIED
jgi:hypothetical protein